MRMDGTDEDRKNSTRDDRASGCSISGSTYAFGCVRMGKDVRGCVLMCERVGERMCRKVCQREYESVTEDVGRG